MMDKTIETELKLRILERSMWDSLPKSAWLRGLLVEGSTRLQTMESTYYDTPARTLWKAGFAFRIRREENQWIATLKGMGRSGGGLSQRREWNAPLASCEAGLEVFEQMPGAEKADKLLQGQPGLAPLFKTVFTRWSVLVNSPKSSGVLELVMDKGYISAGDKMEDLFEVEIEVKEGDIRDLLTFGAELSNRFPLLPEEKSKYYRGLCLADLLPVQEEKCENAWPTSAEAFFSEAVQTALKAQTAYYSEPDSTEKLHDLRVAMRKLRSRVSFAAPRYCAEEGLHWKEVLRTWSRRMARIRELDMLQEEWKTASGYLGIDSRQSPLALYLKAQRGRVSVPFDRVIQKGKLTADLLAFWSWAIGGVKDDVEEVRWEDYSVLRLRQWLKKFGQLAKKIDVSDATAMHGLRIRGKKVRYVLEGQIECGGDSNTTNLAAKLKRLQDCLGDIQDSVQEHSAIQKMFRGKHKKELAREIGCLAGWQIRRGYDGRLCFGSQRKEFRKVLKEWLKRNKKESKG